MKVLVVGSGGREHALVWKLKQSPKVSEIFCAPGSDAISELATCVPIRAENIEELCVFAKKEKIALTVVGPELPLTLGIVDEFTRSGLKIFGPTKRASVLEGSKSFAKTFMQKYKIPTANYGVFTEADEARIFARGIGLPVVIKADGLAAGKGVFICRTAEECNNAIDECLKKHSFADAGMKIVVEEFLDGEEVSIIGVSDGHNVSLFASSQDHKRALEGDKGPNTGGMGAYSPAPIATVSLENMAKTQVMEPLVRGMAAEGRPFVGFLYAGLMVVRGEPYVLEFNVRMGDPETQPLMMRLSTDLVDVLEAALDGDITKLKLKWDARPAVCVVMASKGYPGVYEKGRTITGLDAAAEVKDAYVFHAGTVKKDGAFVNSGGRVLGVTALGDDIKGAIKNAYSAVEKISWDGVQYRKDIGWRAI